MAKLPRRLTDKARTISGHVAATPASVTNSRRLNHDVVGCNPRIEGNTCITAILATNVALGSRPAVQGMCSAALYLKEPTSIAGTFAAGQCQLPP
jgi:hypothetical protein